MEARDGTMSAAGSWGAHAAARQARKGTVARNHRPSARLGGQCARTRGRDLKAEAGQAAWDSGSYGRSTSGAGAVAGNDWLGAGRSVMASSFSPSASSPLMSPTVS